jgi:hypothetical protein
LGPQEIAGRLKLNRKAAAKYMKVEDFSGPLLGKRASASKRDLWKPKIDEWLEEDRRMLFKQRHTAKRVHQRLQSECPEAYRCSYPLVQRYVHSTDERRRTAVEKLAGKPHLVVQNGANLLHACDMAGKSSPAGNKGKSITSELSVN